MSFTFPLHRDIGGGLLLTHTRPGHAGALAELQAIVFPDLAPQERFSAANYRKHVEIFPEGQMLVLDGERAAGMTTTIRMGFDFEASAQHSFAEVSAGGDLTTHEPDGEWLYGMDIGTHPEYRRRGIAKALYRARQDLVRHLGLRGQVTVGMMNGYGAVKQDMTAEEYFEKLKAGAVYDPTVSTQCRLGFRPMCLVPDYLHDPTCDNYGVLIALDADIDI
ncbi:MAG: GNAT family N-acetyltransferase [Sumerlaeia bacterium]